MKVNIVLLLTTIILLIGTLCVQTTNAGACVAVNATTFTSRDILTGINLPTCYNILKSSGITHYWVDDDQIPDGKLDGTCVNQGQFVLDAPVRELSHIFTSDQPSTLCQQVIGTAICLTQFRQCDPKLDNNVDGHVTREKNRPCKWTCDALLDTYIENGHDLSVCNSKDRIYLKTFGIDFDKTGSAVGLPQFDCSNEYNWSNDDETCFSSGALIERTIAPQCVEYSGSVCGSIFPAGTYVHLAPGITVQDIENAMDITMILRALPLQDQTCAQSLVRYLCGIVYPECVQQNMSIAHTINNNGVITQTTTNFIHPVPLRTGVDTCQSYLSECSKVPVFSENARMNAAMLPLRCQDNNNLNLNTCYPTGLDITNAIDFYKMEEMGKDDELMNPSTAITSTPVDLEEYLQDEDHLDDSSSFNTLQNRHSQLTQAQINQINYINSVYDFNSVMFLKKYDYVTLDLSGPTTDKQSNIISGTAYSGSTFYINSDADLPFVINCPSPLVIPEEYSDADPTKWGNYNLFQGYCAVPCPSPVYSASDRRDIEIGSFIMVIIALVFSGVLSVTFLVFHSQRHKWLLFYYTLSYFGVCLFMFQGLMNRSGTSSTFASQCENNTTLYHMKGFGLYTSIFLVYFLIASSSWWLMLCIDLWQRLIMGHLYKRGSVEYKRRRMAFHIFCWGAPVICVIALLVGSQLGYNGSLPWAFIAIDPRTQSDPIDLSWAFFFVPILLCVGTGLILVTIIITYLIKQDSSATGLKKFQDQMEKDKGSFRAKLKNILKLLGFIFLIIIFIVILIVHQVYVANGLRQWSDSLKKWAEAKLFVGMMVQVPYTRMEPERILLSVFGFCSPGYVMFILYMVLDSSVWGLWMGFFYNMCGCECLKRCAKDDTVTGSDSGDSNSGSDSQGSSGGSNKSTDIFSGESWEVLNNKRKGDTHTAQSQSDPDVLSIQSAGSSTGGSSSSVFSSGPTSPSAMSPSTIKQTKEQRGVQQQKRQSLFKGFKNNQVLGSGGPGAGSSSRSNSQSRGALPSSPSFDFPNDFIGGTPIVEMAEMEEGHEDDI